MMKQLFQRFTLLLVGLQLNIPAVFAQNQVAVSGTVNDAGGQQAIDGTERAPIMFRPHSLLTRSRKRR